MRIPFDNGSLGKYQIELYPDQAENGDGIVLNADREGFLALAEIFRQMAEGPDTHVHLEATRRKTLRVPDGVLFEARAAYEARRGPRCSTRRPRAALGFSPGCAQSAGVNAGAGRPSGGQRMKGVSERVEPLGPGSRESGRQSPVHIGD